MNTILNIMPRTPLYNNSGMLWRFKDRMKIANNGNKIIKELNLSVYRVNIPCNVYTKAYNRNIETAKYVSGVKNSPLALNIWRMLDYTKFSEYQKKFFAFSVVKSIKLFLALRGKNISNSCIAIYDAKDKINYYIIEELSKVAKYIVLVSFDIYTVKKIREKIIINYGVTPIITREYDFAINKADFIITSKDIDPQNNKKNIWYVNDRYIPKNRHNMDVNKVLYKVPWNMEGLETNIQNLSAILNIIGSSEVERDLKANDIYIDDFGFNIKCNKVNEIQNVDIK
ncbi:hypothetical protein ACER0A_013240 [Haloimpatiens sp. FM7315]|uniref:hypothetical protein n=1 Tax=Haloimpatiens sp. FM7315 TaxID=3298609 RepID=UPI00370A2EBB